MLLFSQLESAIWKSKFSACKAALPTPTSQLNHADVVMGDAQPEIDLVSEAQNRSQEMKAAINADLYPGELFHQIVSLLPEEGIRRKEFQIDGDGLLVGGEATTVNQALAFKGQLAACIQILELRQKETQSMLTEVEMWRQRRDWLPARQPAMTSEKQASEELLETLLATAATHELTVQKKQVHEPVTAVFYREVGVTLTIRGPVPSVFRWMQACLLPQLSGGAPR